MRVLYISTWFPYPPDNGARIRAYHLLKGLAREHDVHLISLLQQDSDPANADHLSDFCRVVSLHPSRWFRPGTLKSLLGFFTATPRSVVDTYDHTVARAVKDAVISIRPDVIVASTIGVAAYVPHDFGVPTVLDEHNCEFAILRRAADRESASLRRFRQLLGCKKAELWESRICRKFSTVTIVSEQDRILLLQSAPDIKSVHVTPNGVDTAHYDPATRMPVADSLLYNGALTYGANLDAVSFFVSDIYPLLKGFRPDAVLRVTGRTDGVDVSHVANRPGVQLTGYVEDMRAVLDTSAVCIVPLRQGGGSRLKILEAMAAGVPVVSTTIGAEGLSVDNGKHILIADTPTDFAAATARVLSDPVLAQQLSTSARQLVEAHYSWQTIADSFTRIVESTAARCDGDETFA